ncbi:MAG: hypothetical protein JJU11_01055 [Candidatus Sumerlaeia bacterium]|nr:hypothetical protein [Candidatus Sumerlaeia bacterium]
MRLLGRSRHAAWGRRGSARPKDLAVFVGIFVLLGIAAFQQHGRLTSLEYRHELFRQRLKLPPTEVLQFITLGYDNIYANWLWLQSIQAFGQGWITDDGTTKPIYQYFDTLTDVDPKFISAYRFANLIIGDNRKDWDLGTRILEKGSLRNPMDYNLPHLGIYNALWQYDGEDDARWFAARLRNIPNAPGFMQRMVEYIERQAGRYEAAFAFNVRYYLDYKMHNNDLELEIVIRRTQDLLERWYLREMGLAAQKFYEANGRHPETMEELLHPDYMEPYDAPTMQGFQYATDSAIFDLEYSPDIRSITDELIDRASSEAYETIVGMPPDPRGYWYLIHEPRAIYKNERGDVPDNWEMPSYITSAYELVEETNRVAIGAQGFIMQYHQENNGALPPDEEMRMFLSRDPLGGHYVYQREAPESPTYGVFYSTAGRRISEGQEIRLGLRGAGPFPFAIQPRLSENEVDRQWGIENGFIDEHGEEIWFLPGDEPWLQEEPPDDWEELPVDW